MRIALLSLALFGCTGSTGTDDSGATTDDSGTTDDTGSTFTCPFESTDPGTGSGDTLTGTITDASGTALANAEIGLCKSICRSLCTDDNGQFSYGAIPADTYSFHVAPPHDAEGLVEVTWPITFDGSGASLTEDVTLIERGTAVALPSTAAELELATGLFVTLAQGDLTILFEDDPTEASAVEVTSDIEFPLPSDTGSLVAAWYLHPYEADAEDGAPLRIEDRWSYAEGDQVHVWGSSYDDFAWLDLGTFTRTNGSFVADSAAGELTVFATLVVMEEPSNP